MAVLQLQVQNYQEIRKVDMILPMLNKYEYLANAWNIDVRYFT